MRFSKPPLQLHVSGQRCYSFGRAGTKGMILAAVGLVGHRVIFHLPTARIYFDYHAHFARSPQFIPTFPSDSMGTVNLGRSMLSRKIAISR
jgi:hypothetical protein